MTDLATFLLARIADDEAVASAATSGPWRHDPTKWNSIDHEESVFAGPLGLSATTVANTGPGDDPQSMSDAAHIARHDPARVLAECASKRAIVEAMIEADSDGSVYFERGFGLQVACYHLAAVYRDHPDYDQSWTLT